MAPKKKQSGQKNKELSKEFTPVKASTSRADAHSPATCTARGATESEGIEESPSPGIFSPRNKPACDIEWAWKSPIGRLGSSANTTKRRLINKTPVQKTKRCAKASSPLNHFPSKRKLIKSDPDSDHLSVLTSQLQALKQCVLEDGTSTNQSMCLPLPINTKIVQDNSLTALLDDDNFTTLLQCSQYIEEKLHENPDKTTFSPICLNGPVKRIPQANQISTPNPIASPTTLIPMPLETHPQLVDESCKSPLKDQRTLTETEENKVLLVDSPGPGKLVVESLVSIQETLPQVKPLLEKKPLASKCYETFADDSFDDVLANFCDENIELLSQGKTSSSSQQETPKNVLELSISYEDTHTNLPSSSEMKTYSRSQEKTLVENKILNPANDSMASYSFDDDFLQPDLLKLLDAIESSDRQRIPSPHQCTPAEIEKKRLEAKKKLEKKARASRVETNRLPSRASMGNVRR